MSTLKSLLEATMNVKEIIVTIHGLLKEVKKIKRSIPSRRSENHEWEIFYFLKMPTYRERSDIVKHVVRYEH